VECNAHERGISCKICNYSTNYISKERLVYFNNRIAITFDLANKGQPINWCSVVLTKLLVGLTR